MIFNKFKSKLEESIYGSKVIDSSTLYGKTITLTESNGVFIDNRCTAYVSIDEARAAVKCEKLESDLIKTIYEDSNLQLINIIKEHYDIKITNTLIESYKDLATSKVFTTDPVVLELRELNKMDFIVENKIDYVLNDGSTVAIDKDTQIKLNSYIDDKYNIIDYMRESKENFIDVIKKVL